MNYYIGTDRYGNYDLAHAGEWKQHKYIRKEGNRYIYPEDLAKGGKKSKGSGSNSGSGNDSKYIDSEYREALASNSRPNVYPNSDVSKARDLAQQRGYARTRQYKSDGFDSMKSTLYPNGETRRSTEYTRPRLEREFEQNAGQRAADKIAAKAKEAAEQAQERGRERTQREDERIFREGAAKGRKLEEIRRRGQQQTKDIREQDYRVRDYNVSKDTPGAIKKYHSSGYGTGEYFKLESPKEHAARLREGVQSRKVEVRAKRAIKSVARWGAKQINSVKSYAKSGAELVSGLFNKKKK